MSEPVMVCIVCGRQREVVMHKDADYPQGAARKWLNRHCESRPKVCEVRFVAGSDIEAFVRAIKRRNQNAA